jgi:hypothetical protein
MADRYGAGARSLLLYGNGNAGVLACRIAAYLFNKNSAMTKCISGHSAYDSAMAMAKVAIPVAPPLLTIVIILHTD